MTAEATAGSVYSAGPAGALPRRSFGGLVSISIFWFALNFHWAALPVFIITPQVVGLLYRAAPHTGALTGADWANHYKALGVALVLAPGLVVALLANPFFGLLSDHTRGRFGRRRPYILGGTLINVVALAIMATVPAALIQNGSGQVLSISILVLMGGLMLTQLANNAAAAPFHALLPDLVPAEQRGAASGVMGVAYWLGTIGGSTLPFIFSLNYNDLLQGTQSFAALQSQLLLAYATLIGVMLVMALLTVIFVHETPWSPPKVSAGSATGAATGAPEARAVRARTGRDLIVALVAVVAASAIGLALLSLIGLGQDANAVEGLQGAVVVVAAIGAARAFDFRPRRDPDFTWVVLTRLLVTLGIYIVLSSLQFYTHDVAHADPGTTTGEFLIVATAAATLSTAFAGWASDRVGRKRMVYFCGALMGIVGVAFVIAPYVVPGHVLPVLFVAGAIFGLGFGAYISVDWALVVDVLPSQATFARDMGVWNIGLTVAQVFATLFAGALLTVTNYSEGGYSLLFVSFVLFGVLGTVTVRFIKGVK
jgi:MFS family permease